MKHSTRFGFRACMALCVCAVSTVADANTGTNAGETRPGGAEQPRRVLAHPPPFLVMIRDVDPDREVDADRHGGHSYLGGSSVQLISEPWRMGVAAGGGHRSPDGRNEHKFIITYMGSLGHLQRLPQVMGGERFSQDGSRSRDPRMDVYVLSFYERRGDGWEDSADLAVIYEGEEKVVYLSERAYIRLGPGRMRENERAEAVLLIREQRSVKEGPTDPTNRRPTDSSGIRAAELLGLDVREPWEPGGVGVAGGRGRSAHSCRTLGRRGRADARSPCHPCERGAP